jgi:hypothetical protein
VLRLPQGLAQLLSALAQLLSALPQPGLWQAQGLLRAVPISFRRPCAWHGPAKAVSGKPQPEPQWKGWCEKKRS